MERQRPEALKMPTLPEIKPAIGEEKGQLEKRISKILASPKEITCPDFISFVQGMIALTGGVEITVSSYLTILMSNPRSPLRDKQHEKHIRFHVDQVDQSEKERKTTAQIIVGDQADWHQEGCETVLNYALYGVIGDPDKWLLEIPVFRRTPFNSYVTGKQEEPTRCRELDPSEVKIFLKKVFAVYQRQGQPTQPPTPQN